ncbi:MAG TPA: CDP-alcohol phosphatidyltransferase family protein, partial [Gemmatimonadaceae bacterium]|nr:CDP-alcohol phosphatidyltransferase family protein [Gemmatimonadaceae bacterium]
MRRPRMRRPTIRRAVVQLPNGFTLFNLFCGIFAIVLASRQDFAKAVLFVFLGGIADALDGRVARATGSGSRMGEELDSLVDAISFGFAPAMIMYFAVFNTENWEWLFVFIFTACAVVRLAR